MPRKVDELVEIIGLAVAGNPLVALILGVIAIIALIIPIAILWKYGLLTAFVFFAISVVALHVLGKAKLVNVEKTPWVFVIPFAMFFLGFYSEKYGFYVTPLQEKPPQTSPFLISPTQFVTSNIETILLLTLFILLTLAFLIKEK